jgi:hypothetical protein
LYFSQNGGQGNSQQSAQDFNTADDNMGLTEGSFSSTELQDEYRDLKFLFLKFFSFLLISILQYWDLNSGPTP